MNDFEVLFYETESGEMPAMDFLDSLDIKMRAKAARTIKLLQANGNSLREPHSKPVADGIFELRVQVASNISRVLYFFAAGRRVVLTNGFVKKTAKTPQEEIERAKRYRADFLRRGL